MVFNLTFKKIIIICIIFIGLVSAGFIFLNYNEKKALKIISLDMIQSDGELNYTVTVKVKNTGSSDINNATLNFIFIKDNDIADSDKQSLDLPMGREKSYNATFNGIPFDSESTYTAIITIYLGDTLLDSKTVTK